VIATPQERDALWRRYLSARRMAGTDAECRYAFNAWWKHEKAAAVASKRAEQKATKREQAKALRA